MIPDFLKKGEVIFFLRAGYFKNRQRNLIFSLCVMINAFFSFRDRLRQVCAPVFRRLPAFCACV